MLPVQIGAQQFARSSFFGSCFLRRYEADINYDKGFRNRQRILYSNDGLIFVTYDHYQTFYEITP